MLIASGIESEVLAPADGVVLGSVRQATQEDIDAAVDLARKALNDWRRAAPHERASVLATAADHLRSQTDDLAVLHSRESGKVISQARNEILGAASLLEENAHVGRFDAGYLAPTGALPGGERDMTLVERVPLGVVACIIPFNFPVELTIEKVGAALAAGNTAIIKPPPQNPLATIATAQILIDAGLPEGVLSVVTGDIETSSALCVAEGVDAVSLTGSVGAGVAVAQSTAHLLRPLHLELGGNGAAVVLEDADLDHVVSETMRGRLLMNGQACAATKRLVVHRAIVDEVAERLTETLKDVAVGDPTEWSSEVGPLIDRRSADRVASQVAKAVSQGGNLIEGRAEADRAWFLPALLGAVPATADVAIDDEIFGPVITMVPFDSDEEALAITNSSRLALTAAVFSNDLERALALAERFDVGGIVINGSNNYRPPVVPFGGVGLAGSGREGIGYTYEDLTRTRFIAIRGLRPAGAPVRRRPS